MNTEGVPRSSEASAARKASELMACQIMSTNPVMMRYDESIGRAAELLYQHNIRHLPIVRGGELVGIVSDRDLRERIVTVISGDNFEPGAPETIRAIDVCRTDLITISPETGLLETMDLFIEYKVGALPVVDSDTGHLVGIVSYIDVLKAVRSLAEG